MTVWVALVVIAAAARRDAVIWIVLAGTVGGVALARSQGRDR